MKGANHMPAFGGYIPFLNLTSHTNGNCLNGFGLHDLLQFGDGPTERGCINLGAKPNWQTAVGENHLCS